MQNAGGTPQDKLKKQVKGEKRAYALVISTNGRNLEALRFLPLVEMTKEAFIVVY
jgi:hypothetical protein